ncbi:MAG: hypothetical protein RL423_594 [Bacteroidota bacterium]
MRYSTPSVLLKYLQYYWVASNSKGHGIHSPFVFKFIQEILNGKSPLTAIENNTPAVNQILDQIEAAVSAPLTPKNKIVIARLLQSNHPVSFSVTGDMKPFDADSAINTNAKIGSTQSVESIDFAFIGKGQNKETMLQSASRLFDKMHSNSWLILHGIHADSNMETVWNTLKEHSNIRLSIDLFTIGILFCRKEQKEQEHFIIRY